MKLSGRSGERRGFILWLLAVVVLAIPHTALADLVGRATVIDGDTIEIHGVRIRIFGVDAPEASQLCRGSDSLHYRCGAQAANELGQFVGQGTVACTPVAMDRYARQIATCIVNDRDIGEWLVRHGHALDWPKYSRGKYSSAQEQAAKEEAGIWAGSFAKPWHYRDCMKRLASLSKCSDL
jgi:endonuclease YncB( thermonuclease family)